ncbi:MAG: prepilin-type N-terminal cleavage/methylation domain-containing protein [Pseudomonadota bacterium]|nr:MAG: prepilin-type N-terminal cleavage/methylation domain-containing protein [Pseudomonadota bacterium]
MMPGFDRTAGRPRWQVCRAAGPVTGVPGWRGRQAGFTLVEVLLAIALVALIMAMAYGGFRASVRATSSGEALIEETNRLRIVHQFLRRQLMQSRSLIIETLDEEAIIRFEGERDRIRFVAPMPGYLSYGGPYVQQISLERGDDGLELVYYYAMLNGYEPGDLESSDGIVLLDGLADGEFIFLDAEEDGMSTFWTDYWEAPERLPLGVGVLLDMDRANGLSWPDLIVPVMIDSDRAQQPRGLRRASDLLMPPGRDGSDRRRR